MKNKIEIAISFLLIVLAIFLLNPFNFWMPDMVVVGVLAFVLVLFGIYASFILKEKAFDERDNLHRTLAGRNAFLMGSAIVMLGIVVQGYSHSVDPWLVIALTSMIVVKVVTRIWSDRNY